MFHKTSNMFVVIVGWLKPHILIDVMVTFFKNQQPTEVLTVLRPRPSDVLRLMGARELGTAVRPATQGYEQRAIPLTVITAVMAIYQL